LLASPTLKTSGFYATGIKFIEDGIVAILKRLKTATRRPWEKCLLEQGDILWVQETWANYQTINHIKKSDGRAFSEISDGMAGYKADGFEDIEEFRNNIRLMSGADFENVEIADNKWLSQGSMPRWASRITLEVVDVRREKLQDITEDDARAEGIIDGGCLNCGNSEPCGCNEPLPSARDVLMDRFEMGEKAMSEDSECSYCYARNALKGRFEQGERAIKKDKYVNGLYQEKFKLD
jgi:hypothetical protein